MDFLSTVIELFIRYGYLVVFLGVMLENAALPVPGEAILLAAGFFAAQGQLNLVMVISVAIVGAILGDNWGYLLGCKAGRPFLIRYGRWLFLTRPKLDEIQKFFQAHGEKTILIARFITGLRVVAALLAGISHMNWWRFFAYNSAGAVMWATVMGSLGYFFGESWTILGKWVGRGGLILLGATIIGALLIWLERSTIRLKRAFGVVVPEFLRTRETVMILLNLTVLAVFTKVAQIVVRGRATRFDRNILLTLHGFASPSLDTAMLVVRFLGSGAFLILIGAALGVWCYRQGKIREAKFMSLGLLASPGLIAISKIAFRRPGPDLWDLIVKASDFSFPCGAATNSLVILGLAAYILAKQAPQRRSLYYAGASILIAAVGFCQIYLGVHWPTDVLAGYAFGALLLFLLIYWYAGDYNLFWRAAPLPARESEAAPEQTETISRQEETSKKIC